MKGGHGPSIDPTNEIIEGGLGVPPDGLNEGDRERREGRERKKEKERKIRL